MREQSKRSVWTQIALILIVLATVSTAQGAVLTYSQVLFTSPVFGFSSGDVVVPATSTGGYSFAAEFCVNEFCSGGPVPTSADSLLRLTNLTLTCNTPPVSSLMCAPIDVLFQADDEASSIPSGLLQVQLTGGGAATGYARICLTDGTNLCASDLTGNESVTVGFSGSISGNNSLTAAFPPGFELLGDFHLDGLPVNSSVTLSNSLDIRITSFTASSLAPEPATMWLLPFGLLLLALVRRARATRDA